VLFKEDGLFTIQLEGAQPHKTGVQIEVAGTDGVLRIFNPRGFQNKGDNALEGMRDDAETFTPLPVPEKHAFLAPTRSDGSSHSASWAASRDESSNRWTPETASSD
jgi:hypothetical protein